MKEKQGVSLIVLVITIIVMVILAGAIVLTINNSGIISKAEDAVEQTNLATVKELAQMAWASAYSFGATEQELQQAVDKALVDSKIDTSKYTIKVTTSGVTVELKSGSTDDEMVGIEAKWVRNGLTVTNGRITLEIGDYIYYDETKGETITGLTATDWQVLGANDDGELLILSTNVIATVNLAGRNGYVDGVEYLTEVCEPYGYGKSATGARSIVAEDIFDAKEEYNVTYTWTGPESIIYTGPDGVKNEVSDPENFYLYFSNGSVVNVNRPGETANYPIEITTVTCCEYNEQIVSQSNAKAYNMLFGEFNSEYWVATSGINAENWILYGINYVAQNEMKLYTLACSLEESLDNHDSGVRAVVTLAPDVQLTGSLAGGWDIK